MSEVWLWLCIRSIFSSFLLFEKHCRKHYPPFLCSLIGSINMMNGVKHLREDFTIKKGNSFILYQTGLGGGGGHHQTLQWFTYFYFKRTDIFHQFLFLILCVELCWWMGKKNQKNPFEQKVAYLFQVSGFCLIKSI